MSSNRVGMTVGAHRRRARPWNLYIGAALISIVIMMAVVSFIWLPHDPAHVQVLNRFESPSANHWLGTDHLGRDVFSRILVGARTVILVGFLAVAVGVTVGVIVGSVAAFAGGWTDELLMRVMDALGAYPPVLAALLLASIFGPGTATGTVAIGIATVPVFARLVRSNILTLREAEFVEAAKALGAGSRRIITQHMWPNTAGLILVQATVTFGQAVLAEAALSYLGLGTQPPAPSWGRMLRDAQDFLFFSAYPAVFPGIAIALTVLGLNLLGDGLRDQIDPRHRGS